ncbi:hypothetical protein CER19_25195 [Pseudomonas sp. GL93]|nr:hypothetical protein CER19_25195 [Pseudomonas sp. GL93]
MMVRDFDEFGSFCISLIISGVNAVFRFSRLFVASASCLEGEVSDGGSVERGRSGAFGVAVQFGPALSIGLMRSGVALC